MIADFLTSGVAGLITGLVGPAIKSWFSLKQQEIQVKQQAEQHRHDETMVTLQSQADIAEVQANIQRDRVQAAGRIEEAIVTGMGEVLKSADTRLFNEAYLNYLQNVPHVGRFFTVMIVLAIVFVDLWRQVVRPMLTTYLIGATTWVTVLAYRILNTTGEAITADYAQTIFTLVLQTVIYLTVTAVSFWFYDRAKDLKDQVVRMFK